MILLIDYYSYSLTIKVDRVTILTYTLQFFDILVILTELPTTSIINLYMLTQFKVVKYSKCPNMIRLLLWWLKYSKSWRFLERMMVKMSFFDGWLKWMSACIFESSMSVLVNGSPSEDFKVGRGLCQGNPLSPFLFCFRRKVWLVWWVERLI
jgi:hypothetical protein